MSTKKRKKSSAKSRRARKLAKSLPRDKKGKFLPKGSKNLFKKKRKRRKSVPARKRKTKTKKARRKSVGDMGSKTGGTGDVKPQILTLTTGLPQAIDTYTVDQSILPVPRFGPTASKATIFEVLWVHWYLAIRDVADGLFTKWAWLSTITGRSTGDVASLASAEGDVAEPRTFAFVLQNRTIIVQGSSSIQYPIVIDLTDRNGNGILIATDRIVITSGQFANTALGGTIAKIGYRLVNVGIKEYVGIVQSQQGS